MIEIHSRRRISHGSREQPEGRVSCKRIKFKFIASMKMSDRGEDIITYPAAEDLFRTLRPVNRPASSTSLNPSGLVLPSLLPALFTRSAPLPLRAAATLLSTSCCTTRRYSYKTPSATITKKEKMKEALDCMCH